MKRTFSIQVKKNHYILQELNTDGSELSVDEWYDWVEKYNVRFLFDEELNDLIFEVINKNIFRIVKKSEVKDTIYDEVLDVKKWVDIEGDYYVYYVKPKIIFL